MKVTNKTLKPGLTLIELTVVIVVLLSLIGVLFIGATAWRNGADRSTCIVNMRNIQQAVGSYVNLQQLAQNATIDINDVVAEGFLQGVGGNPTATPPVPATPAATCPLDGASYTFTGPAFNPNASFATCTNNGASGATVNDHIFTP